MACAKDTSRARRFLRCAPSCAGLACGGARQQVRHAPEATSKDLQQRPVDEVQTFPSNQRGNREGTGIFPRPRARRRCRCSQRDAQDGDGAFPGKKARAASRKRAASLPVVDRLLVSGREGMPPSSTSDGPRTSRDPIRYDAADSRCCSWDVPPRQPGTPPGRKTDDLTPTRRWASDVPWRALPAQPRYRSTSQGLTSQTLSCLTVAFAFHFGTYVQECKQGFYPRV